MIREVFPLPTVLLLSGAMMCAAFYLYIYFTAEAPRKGTLEWIALYEKPHLCRKGLLHRLKWLDLLWSFLMGLMAFGLYVGFGACVDASMVRASLSSGWAFLTALPAVLAVMASYLLGRLLSGRFLGGFLPALFLSCSILLSLYAVETLLMLGCLLTLLGYFCGKGFWAWLCLVISGILLGLGASISPLNIFLLLPWLGTVLFSEILRFKREDAGIWHTILAPVVGVLAVLLTITVVNFPLHIVTDLRAALKTPGYYLWFWLQLVITIPARLFAAPDISPALLLPSATLLLAGVAMAVGAVKRHHTLGIVVLLWTVFGLLLAVFFPSAHPMFLSVWVLAWLVSRIDARGYRSAALVTGLVPAVLSLFMTFLTIWR